MNLTAAPKEAPPLPEPPWEEVWIRFKPMGGERWKHVPINQRIKALLKLAGRHLGLKHEGLREVKHGDNAHSKQPLEDSAIHRPAERLPHR